MPVDGEHKGPKRLLKTSHGKHLSVITEVRQKYYYYFIIRKARQYFISLLSHAINFDVWLGNNWSDQSLSSRNMHMVKQIFAYSTDIYQVPAQCQALGQALGIHSQWHRVPKLLGPTT